MTAAATAIAPEAQAPVAEAEGRCHIVGAGLAGLACAVALAERGRPVSLYDAAGQAGGRCRSLFDQSLERPIDNGNHLLLSANQAALGFLDTIGAGDSLVGPPDAAFPFLDLRSGERWTLRPNNGPLPWWILFARRRVPGSHLGDYLKGLSILLASDRDTVTDRIAAEGPLWERFWEPLTVAALNTAPEEASARLLRAVVMETFVRGAAACRPLIAKQGLSDSFVEPALAYLRDHGAEINFNWRLRALEDDGKQVMALDFGVERRRLGPTDSVVIALPAPGAKSILPELDAPLDTRPIVNGHIRLPRPIGLPEGGPVLGLIGGTAQWLFLRGDVVSLTVSAAEELAGLPNETVAARLWQDTAKALELDPDEVPPIRIIKEKRATFAQTPEAAAHRPGPETRWRNAFLAGDWTDTGFPATIEGAIRSGQAAAKKLANP
ncbi:MAG: hydroxysqualene dehydroxylase HpnE [Kiloniellales bacterium]|nr:hydroxysqualene dehydroxylase HpnE [Kiloniellales bacterium]